MQDLFAKGGVLVVPIVVCSVLALAIFFERFIRFAVLRKRGLSVAEKVSTCLEKNEPHAAAELAEKSRSPMGRVLAQAMDVVGRDRETLETVLVHAIENEVRELSRYLQTLATIARRLIGKPSIRTCV